MISRILAVGDSFTYGDELTDLATAYPALLAQQFGAQVDNQARPGSGNTRMVRTVVDHVGRNTPVAIDRADLIIIGWSSPGRIEFADATGIYDIWPGYSGNMFTREGQSWRLELIDYISKYHDPQYLYQQYLLNVIMLQNFLKSHNQRYVMLTTVSNEYYHNTYCSQFAHLTQLVDAEHYLGWPREGMAEWTQSCPRGAGGHFLEEGHQQVAKKIYHHVNSRI
jgi:hypothetical protein